MKRLRTYNSANAWLSAEMVGNYYWIHQFSAPEIAEQELAAIKVLDNEIINLSCEDFELPTLDPQLELTLSRLNNYIDAWLAGDYRVDSARLEAQLSIIRWGNAGEHLSQWMIFRDELAMGTAILNSRLAKQPLCFKDMKTKVADRFHALVRQFLIGSIQPQVARLNRDHYSLFPLLRSLEGKLSIGEPSAYTAWRKQRDLLLDHSVSALSRHVRSLEPLLKQCGYLPAG